jgi:hypothetical protein
MCLVNPADVKVPFTTMYDVAKTVGNAALEKDRAEKQNNIVDIPTPTPGIASLMDSLDTTQNRRRKVLANMQYGLASTMKGGARIPQSLNYDPLKQQVQVDQKTNQVKIESDPSKISGTTAWGSYSNLEEASRTPGTPQFAAVFELNRKYNELPNTVENAKLRFAEYHKIVG